MGPKKEKENPPAMKIALVKDLRQLKTLAASKQLWRLKRFCHPPWSLLSVGPDLPHRHSAIHTIKPLTAYILTSLYKTSLFLSNGFTVRLGEAVFSFTLVFCAA
jgi:hypothetical protein